MRMKNLLLVLNFVLFVFVGKGQVPCSLDNTFDQDGKLTSDGSRIADRICALPDDKSIVAYNPMSTGHVYVKKLNADEMTEHNSDTGELFDHTFLLRRQFQSKSRVQ